MNYSPSYIKNYDCLRKVTLWAGALGVVQSIIWMALTITAIFTYNGFINMPPLVSFGSIVQYVFYVMYFKGPTTPDIYQDFNHSILNSAPTILSPTDILIWSCVYLGVAVCWLMASVLLLTHFKKDDVKTSIGVLYTWVTLTFFICAMDLSLGIIFGIDYGKLHNEAYNYSLDSGQAGAINPLAANLIAGEIAAISMMIMSFKGFVLWLINVGLFVYLLVHAIRIVNDKDGNDTLFMPRKNSDDILTTRPPIDAYENNKPNAVYNNDAFVPDNRSIGTLELNQEAVARAARMSVDTTLQDRRFRNLDNFQQYPPPRNNARQEPVRTSEIVVATFPAPDYSPPMSRANQNGQRYQ